MLKLENCENDQKVILKYRNSSKWVILGILLISFRLFY